MDARSASLPALRPPLMPLPRGLMTVGNMPISDDLQALVRRMIGSRDGVGLGARHDSGSRSPGSLEHSQP
jgi:hypothetical protein